MSNQKCEGEDILHMGPQIAEDGSRLCIRHTKDHQLQQGVLKTVREGEPLNTDYPCLALEPREDGYYDVNELLPGKAQESSGPAMVNSEKFKTGWDRIFGKETVGVA